MRRALPLLVMVGLLVGVALAAPTRADTWWIPTPGSTLHWNLADNFDPANPRHNGERELGTGAVLPRPDVLDFDGEYNSAADVAYVHARGQKAICYLDAGVFEDYRSDAWKFPKSVIGKPDGNWDGSWWLDIRRLDVLLPIMEARIVDWCKGKGFDGVEPDEIDGWENNTGFPLTYGQQLTYNRAIADLAHKHGLGIVQKGDIIQAQDLQPWFDGTLNEECARYAECTNPWNPVTNKEQVGLQVYSNAGKAVWLAEYRATDCNKARTKYLNKYPTWRGYQFKLGLPANGGRKVC